MGISIVKSSLQADIEKIRSGLRSYNNQYISPVESDLYALYLLKDDVMVAGLHTETNWNWLHIESFDFQNPLEFKILLNELYQHFNKKVQGISYATVEATDVEMFTQNGFEVKGILRDKPLGFDLRKLTNEKMEYEKIGHDYQVIVSKEASHIFRNQVDQNHRKRESLHGLNDSKFDLIYTLSDGDVFVGGLYAYVMHDYLNINLLWVDERYRGRRFASQLVDVVEKDALAMGIANITLGTCSFQARPFYEAKGYHVLMTFDQMPKGYQNYTMVKKL